MAAQEIFMRDRSREHVFRNCFVSILFCLCLGGCAERPIYHSRSELIEEARRSGYTVRTIEEDRRLFDAHIAEQEERLHELVRRRLGGSSVDPAYRIGAQDEIEVNVFDVPELNLTAVVRESGFVNLPLVGAVSAGGRTLGELTEDLRMRLSSFVRNPQVSVFMTRYGSQKVAVLGAVNKPEVYSLRKGTNSIVELIGEAGGLSQKAGNILLFIPAESSGAEDMNSVEERNKIALAAGTRGGVNARGIELYLDQVMGTSGGIPLEIPVRGGDMIVVPEGGKVLVEGEVGKIGSYDLGPQLTLLSALAASGGVTYSANVQEVEVIRELGMNNRVSLVIDLTRIMTGDEKDVRLRNGDIVRVPSNAGRRMTSDTFDGIRKLLNFGIGGSYRLGP